MSYTEYLRRKASSTPVVVDMRPKLDASSYTRQQRLIAAGQSYNTTKAVVGNIDDMISSVSRDNRNSFPATLVSMTKTTAGSVPDASSRSDFLGGQAILEARQTAKPGRVLMNSKSTNSGMTVTSSCRVIPEPISVPRATARDDEIAPVQKGAGDWVRLNKDCVASGRIGEPHEPGMRGTPQFVDDTISLNSGTFRIGTGTSSTTNKTGSTPESSTAAKCRPANHAHPALVPYAAWAPRPRKGAGGLQVSVQPNPGDARKVGGLVPSDHLKYVEAHHGNDLRVNPRRVPIPFQIPNGTPAQLKINDPKRLS
jgi:hypothetical protein